MTSPLKIAFCIATMIVGTGGAHAQAVDNVFLNGARYVYDIHRGESILDSVQRLPNRLIVRNELLPQMAKMYRTCARNAEFRGKVRAIGGVYSSHFSTVTLERHPSMKPAMFSAAIACVKQGVTRARVGSQTQSTSGMIYKSSQTTSPNKKSTKRQYVSSAGTFKVKASSAEVLKVAMSKCVGQTGYKGGAVIQSFQTRPDVVTVSLVRSGTMTNAQYDASLSCVRKRIKSA